MSIGFSNIPADLRVPLFYAEMDNSAANSASSTMRRLIVGQVNEGADSADIGSLVLVPSLALAKTIGGQGSMLAAMYEAWRKVDPVGEVWCLPLQGAEGAAAKASEASRMVQPLTSSSPAWRRFRAPAPEGSHPVSVRG